MIKDLADEKREIDALLAGIHKRYGYDFSNYSFASLKRRLERAREQAKLNDFTALLQAVLASEQHFDNFLRNMSVTVTDMFRDPLFFDALRAQVIPLLKTYPFIKIWHAGCATGEEVYSMAILLHEEGFLDRTHIYATDFNNHSLTLARQGIYPAKRIANYAGNYAASGGKRDFSDYYSEGYERAKFMDFLKERIVFSYHNLVTDGVFGEMNLICCRNVLIYFDKQLQDHVLSLFTESLRHGGFLCLGNKESLKFTPITQCYEPVDAKQRIYRKKGAAYV